MQLNHKEGTSSGMPRNFDKSRDTTDGGPKPPVLPRPKVNSTNVGLDMQINEGYETADEYPEEEQLQEEDMLIPDELDHNFPPPIANAFNGNIHGTCDLVDPRQSVQDPDDFRRFSS